MERTNFGVSMDDRDVAADSAPRVPQPRDAHAAYTELFSATSAAAAAGPAPEPRKKRSRRANRRLLISAVVVLLLVLGGVAGGLAYAANARKQPALDALRTGTAAFEPVASDLRQADDMTDLRAAARPAEAAADEVDAAARKLGEPGSDLERRVRDVLRDESAVLRAAGALTALEIETLGRWPDTRDAMAEAEASLATVVKSLARSEAEAARAVRTGRDLAGHADEVVGDFAGTSMTELLDGQLDELASASTTADLRAVAARTARSGEVVTLALAGVDADGPQGTRISRIGEALEVLGRLRGITGEKLAAWPAVRAALASATDGLEGVDTRNAVNAVDGLVARATQQLKAWRVATAKATAKNKADAEALTTYVTAVGTALEGKVAADAAATAFLTRVREDAELTSAQAATYLTGAAKARDAVRTALEAATPRPALAEQHQALVDVAVQAAAVPRAGLKGTGREKCGTIPATTPEGKPTPAPCYYRDTAGWDAFAAGTPKAAAAHTPAKEAWDEAVEALRTSISERKLPVKPVV